MQVASITAWLVRAGYFPFFTVNLRASELLFPRMSVAVTTRS